MSESFPKALMNERLDPSGGQKTRFEKKSR